MNVGDGSEEFVKLDATFGNRDPFRSRDKNGDARSKHRHDEAGQPKLSDSQNESRKDGHGKQPPSEFNPLQHKGRSFRTGRTDRYRDDTPKHLIL
jgi:hypothetical protein